MQDKLCNKELLAKVPLGKFLKKNQEYDFNQKQIQSIIEDLIVAVNWVYQGFGDVFSFEPSFDFWNIYVASILSGSYTLEQAHYIALPFQIRPALLGFDLALSIELIEKSILTAYSKFRWQKDVGKNPALWCGIFVLLEKAVDVK